MEKKDQLIHDINSQIHSLTAALNLINEGWKDDPSLALEILALLPDKTAHLLVLIADYKQSR